MRSHLASLLRPRLDLTVAPLGEVVHVGQEFLPGHDAWSRIWSDECWALAALWVCADLLAHVLADAGKLVLQLGTAGEVLGHAGLLGGLGLQGGCLLGPRLDLTVAPLGEVVHVRQELLPGHDAWSGVWGDEGWALAALRVGADLLAHVLAHAGKLVLHLRAALLVVLQARGALHLKGGGLLGPRLDL